MSQGNPSVTTGMSKALCTGDRRLPGGGHLNWIGRGLAAIPTRVRRYVSQGGLFSFWPKTVWPDGALSAAGSTAVGSHQMFSEAIGVRTAGVFCVDLPPERLCRAHHQEKFIYPLPFTQDNGGRSGYCLRQFVAGRAALRQYRRQLRCGESRASPCAVGKRQGTFQVREDHSNGDAGHRGERL